MSTFRIEVREVVVTTSVYEVEGRNYEDAIERLQAGDGLRVFRAPVTDDADYRLLGAGEPFGDSAPSTPRGVS